MKRFASCLCARKETKDAWKVTSRTSGIGERAGEISWGREELVRLLTLSARHSPLFVTSLHIATIKMK